MLFNSFEFAVFFVIVYGSYWCLRRSYPAQNMMLLVASYVFYGWWDIRFLFLIVLTTAADYCYGLMIENGRLERKQRLAVSLLLILSSFAFVTVKWSALRWSRAAVPLDIDWRNLLPAKIEEWWVLMATISVVSVVNIAYPWLVKLPEQRRRDGFMIASLVTNLSTLGFFKYFNFFAESFRELASSLFGVTPSSWTLSIVLPVGVSFFTFQSLSYTIDVYRKKIAPEESLGVLLTCLAFFPQLVAGPIERASHLLPQFHRPRSVTKAELHSGAWLVVWGLFQKLVVADNAAVIVNSVFRPFDTGAPFPSAPDDGLRVLIAVYAFALQIFGDFSGYSDIARGTARLMGFDIMQNFNAPYFAVSPSDFWRRWHISLSTWLRDYLYIPLGGNRCSKLLTYRNLFLTMLLGGLWHGAAWTYVLWGVFHGTILIVYHVANELWGGKPAAVDGKFEVSARSIAKQLLAGVFMFHLTCVGWLLFRAQNMATVGMFLKSMLFSPHWSPQAGELAIALLSCSWFLILFQIVQMWRRTSEPLATLPWFARLNAWAFVVMSLLTLSAEGEQTFIYFAF